MSKKQEWKIVSRPLFNDIDYPFKEEVSELLFQGYKPATPLKIYFGGTLYYPLATQYFMREVEE